MEVPVKNFKASEWLHREAKIFAAKKRFNLRELIDKFILEGLEKEGHKFISPEYKELNKKGR